MSVRITCFIIAGHMQCVSQNISMKYISQYTNDMSVSAHAICQSACKLYVSQNTCNMSFRIHAMGQSVSMQYTSISAMCQSVDRP